MTRSTATRRHPSPPTARPRGSRSRRPAPVWFVAGAVVALALIIAVVLAATAPDESSPGVAQTRDVQITGTPLPAIPETGPDTAVGMAVPLVSGAGFDGSPASVSDDGEPKVLLFAAHWCPHCQREIPLLSDHLRASPPAGVAILTIVTGTNASLPNYPPSEWLAREDWPTPILVDDAASSVGAAFGLTGYPYFVAVDANGKVVARVAGELPLAAFDTLVDEARSGG